MLGLGLGRRCHNTYRSEVGLTIVCGGQMETHEHHTVAGKLYPGTEPGGPWWFCPRCDGACHSCRQLEG